MTEAPVRTQAEEWLSGYPFATKHVLEDGAIRKMPDTFTVRQGFIDRYGFAILDRASVSALKGIVGGGARILEVGAGTGYWAYELQRAGFDVLATDSWSERYVPQDRFDRPWHGKFGKVRKLSAAQAIPLYGEDRTLMMVWPDLALWPATALGLYQGPELILVGEWRGCTGCPEMFDTLEAEWEEVGAVAIPQFTGLKDYLSVWRR